MTRGTFCACLQPLHGSASRRRKKNVFGIGELVGVGFLAAVQDARANISWTDAFGPLSWRAALAGASVAMGFWWYYGDEDGKKAWIPFIIGGFGIGLLLWKTATGLF